MKYDSEKTENDTLQKKRKSKRSILARIVNILTGIFVVLAFVFAIQAFYARKHVHNNYFGYAALPVRSDSMKLENGGKDNFKRGDLIFVKLLDAEQKRELEVGDVITFKFFDMNTDKEQLNTHRIIEKKSNGYITQGDEIVTGYKPVEDVSFDSVVGVFKGKVGAVGHVSLFMETKAGMFVMIVVPFILLLLLSVFYFIRNFRAYSKERTVDATVSAIEIERERLRQEILAEMQGKQGVGDTGAAGAVISAQPAQAVQPQDDVFVAPVARPVIDEEPEVQPEEVQSETQIEPEVQPEEQDEPVAEQPEVEQAKEPVAEAKPKTTKSTAAKSTATKSATKPTAAKSTTPKSAAAKSTATKSTATKSTAAKSTTAKSTAAKATAAKTSATKSTATKSTAAKTPAAKKTTTKSSASVDKMPAPKSNIAKTAAREAAKAAAKTTEKSTKTSTTKPKQ